MVEWIIEYLVPFVVIAGMGWGLPRWFKWRRSLINRVSLRRSVQE